MYVRVCVYEIIIQILINTATYFGFCNTKLLIDSIASRHGRSSTGVSPTSCLPHPRLQALQQDGITRQNKSKVKTTMLSIIIYYMHTHCNYRACLINNNHCPDMFCIFIYEVELSSSTCLYSWYSYSMCDNYH